MTTRYIHSLNIDYESLTIKRIKKCDEGGKVECNRAYWDSLSRHFSNWNWDNIRISPEGKKIENLINKKTTGIIKFTRGLKDIELNDYNNYDDSDEKYKKKNYKDPWNIVIIILNGIFPIIFLFTCWYYIYKFVYPNLDDIEDVAFIRKKKIFKILLGIVSVLFLFFNTFIPAKIINDYKMQKKTLGDEIDRIKKNHKKLKKGNTTSSIDNTTSSIDNTTSSVDNNDKNIKYTPLDKNIDDIESQLEDYKQNLPHFYIVKLAILQITIGIVSVVYMLFVESDNLYKIYKDAEAKRLA